MNKIIFPFYNKSKHDFLIKKWWFRGFIVIYIGILLVSMASIWQIGVNQIHDVCLDQIKYPGFPNEFRRADGSYDFKKAFESPESKLEQARIEPERKLCDKDKLRAWFAPVVIKDAIIIPLIIHYLLQFIFFKIIIDFIVFSNQTGNNSNS